MSAWPLGSRFRGNERRWVQWRCRPEFISFAARSNTVTPCAGREITIDRDRGGGAVSHRAGSPVRRALAHVAGRTDAFRRRAHRGIDTDPPGGIEWQQAAKQL